MAGPVINWGIVGTGIISNKFAADFCHVSNARLFGVSSRTRASAQKFANTYDIPNAYQGLDAMLSDPDLHAIYIGTPHTDHFETASRALRAGKAVLCEKPMTVSAQETAKLINIQQETGVYLMEAMWTYFLPAIRKAKEWVDAGRIGDLVAIKGDFGYPQAYDPLSRVYNPDLAGGALLDMGIYPVALAWLFSNGLDPKKCQASAQFAPNGVDDDLSWIFTYDNGVTATLGTSFRSRLPNAGYIIGTEGYIRIPDFFRAHECHLYHLDDCVDSFNDGRTAEGYAFETQAVTDDLIVGRKQSDMMPLSASHAFADHMDMVKDSW